MKRPCGVSGSPLLLGLCLSCGRCPDVLRGSVLPRADFKKRSEYQDFLKTSSKDQIPVIVEYPPLPQARRVVTEEGRLSLDKHIPVWERINVKWAIRNGLGRYLLSFSVLDGCCEVSWSSSLTPSCLHPTKTDAGFLIRSFRSAVPFSDDLTNPVNQLTLVAVPRWGE